MKSVTPADLIPEAVQRGSTARKRWTYTDKNTGREFEVSLLHGANALEVAAGENVSAGPRYVASEFLPNGRLVKEGKGGSIFAVRDVPAAQWAKVRGVPSKALAAIRAAKKKNPGFWAVFTADGFGLNMVVYPDLDAVCRAIDNALAADMWLRAVEPVKHVEIHPGCNATFKARAFIQNAPGHERIMAAIKDIAAALPTGEEFTISDEIAMGRVRLSVTNRAMEYPDSCRLDMAFDSQGRAVPDFGFVRGDWGGIADRIAGFELARYDGPAGYAIGCLPAMGQAIIAPEEQPKDFGDIEIAHSTMNGANKIYAWFRRGGKEYFAWGKFAGPLKASVAAPGTRYTKMDSKLSGGYERIYPEDVPYLWSRLRAACERLSASC